MLQGAPEKEERGSQKGETRMSKKRMGRPRLQERHAGFSEIDNRTYLSYLYARLGHLLPDREKFMTLTTGIIIDVKRVMAPKIDQNKI
jgi:hypothetical protein